MKKSVFIVLTIILTQTVNMLGESADGNFDFTTSEERSFENSSNAKSIIEELNQIGGQGTFDVDEGKIVINTQRNITHENRKQLKDIANQYLGQFGIDAAFIENIKPPTAG